jgi:hypothetical protein
LLFWLLGGGLLLFIVLVYIKSNSKSLFKHY